MRPAAVIDASGVVVNVIVLGTEDISIAGHTIIESGVAQLGDTWDGTSFTPDPARLASELEAWRAKAVLSSAQLAGALLLAGILTAPQARLFGRSGELPQVLLTAIETALDATELSEPEKQIALVQVESATEYRRASPLVPLLGAVFDKTAEELDDLWRAGLAIV
jgi:hypothetical protein